MSKEFVTEAIRELSDCEQGAREDRTDVGASFGPKLQADFALYFVERGRVKLVRGTEDDPLTVLGFYAQNQAFIRGSGERVIGMDRGVSVRFWSLNEISRATNLRPALRWSFLKLLVQILQERNERIESFCLDPVPVRLIKTLLALARQQGQPSQTEGWARIETITHDDFAFHLGTSRGILTQWMSLFRRKRVVAYNRKVIQLNVNGLQKFLVNPSLLCLKTYGKKPRP